jgi:hypothetical protein
MPDPAAAMTLTPDLEAMINDPGTLARLHPNVADSGPSGALLKVGSLEERSDLDLTFRIVEGRVRSLHCPLEGLFG